MIRVEDVTKQSSDLKKRAQQLVLTTLGPVYALSSVHFLSELGYQEYPATATGKVRKTDLREKIRALPLRSESPVKHDSSSSTIIGLWKEVLGLSIIDLNNSTPVSQFADSLVSLKFCLQVEKRLGKRMTPADLSEHDTPDAQARFLETQSRISADGSERNYIVTLSRQGQPFSSDQSWIATEDLNRASSCLEKLGFNWDDVESVYQPGGSMPMLMVSTTRKAAVNVRWAWRAREDIPIGRMMECLAWALKRHQALRVVLAPTKDGTSNPPVLHLAMKPNKKWFSSMMTESDAIREIDVAGLVQSLAMPCGTVGGSALQVRVLPVIGSSKPVLFIAANHAVFDAFSFGHFKEDLERCLSNQHTEDSSWIPYSTFADMYRLYESSGLGQKNIAYHVTKLRTQLRNAEPCLWPPLKGPGLMTGANDSWGNGDMAPAPLGKRVSLDGGKDGGKPVMRIIRLPDLPELQRLYGVLPSTLLKAAIAIINVELTGQDRAVFSHTDAGRRWPFMEPWIEQQLPNIMHVSGPTLEVCQIP